jgi:peptidoglycan-associated lipoprotein
MKKVIPIILLGLVVSCSNSGTKEDIANDDNLLVKANSIDLEEEYRASKEKQLKKNIENRKQHVLFFSFDNSVINDKNKVALDSHADYLVSHRNVTVFLAGSTDEIASHDYNKALSNKRVKMVQNYLISKGVSSKQLILKGLGKNKNLDFSNTPKGDSYNRRVTLIY